MTRRPTSADFSTAPAAPDTPVSFATPLAGYADWLAELKSRIHSAQQRAALAVNRELVSLYWQIGRDILARQAQQGWGAKVIERLAHDLRASFPDMKGFSRANHRTEQACCHGWSLCGACRIASADSYLTFRTWVKRGSSMFPCDSGQLDFDLLRVGQGQHVVDYLRNAVGLQRQVVVGAVRRTGAGVEQAQVATSCKPLFRQGAPFRQRRLLAIGPPRQNVNRT